MINARFAANKRVSSHSHSSASLLSLFNFQVPVEEVYKKMWHTKKLMLLFVNVIVSVKLCGKFVSYTG